MQNVCLTNIQSQAVEVTMATGVTPEAHAPPVGEDMRQPLMTTILEHVERGEAREVKVIMESRSIAEHIKSIAWDLVPQVCDFLTDEVCRSRSEVIDTAETVLTQLALKAKPKEVLLVLLEQADNFKDDVKFKVLLPAIQTCLLQLPVKRGHSLAISIETLYAHVATLPAPERYSLEGEERKLLENNSDVMRINDVSHALIDFLKPLAEKITHRENTFGEKVKDISEQRELVRCVLKLLNYPLASLDTSYRGEKVKTESRLNAERVMGVMRMIQPDYVKLLNLLNEENFQIDQQKRLMAAKKKQAALSGDIPDDMDDYDVQEKYTELSLSVLAYLAFGEGLGMEDLPQVYTPQYLFELVLPYVSHLLSCSEPLTVEKGVRLLHSVLARLPDGTMPADILEWEELATAVGLLIRAMTQNQCKDICRAAVQILPLWMTKFTPAGRHKSLYFLLMKEQHSGLAAYAIQLLKNEVDRALKLTPCDENFVGGHLEKLLELVFNLSNGAQTDLLEHSERVMAALNLLRYLVIRDQPAVNASGIWGYIGRVEREFCEPLRTGINLSRAHYELEVGKAKKGTSELLNKCKVDPDMSFSVGGQSLPDLTPKQQMQVMHMALHTFDMMQSVLSRVEELVDQQRKETEAAKGQK